MTVQRLHANDAYTFAPYNAYFNDYYTPDGDGAIAGRPHRMIHSIIFRARAKKNCWPPALTVTPVCWIALKAPMQPMPRRVIWLCPQARSTMQSGEELDALVKERKLKDNDTDGRRTLVRSWPE